MHRCLDPAIFTPGMLRYVSFLPHIPALWAGLSAHHVVLKP